MSGLKGILRKVVVLGTIVSIAAGLLFTVLRAFGVFPRVEWGIAVAAIAVIVIICIVRFFRQESESHKPTLFLATGAIAGAAVITFLPVNTWLEQLTFGVAGFMATMTNFDRIILNRVDRRRTAAVEDIIQKVSSLPLSDRGPVSALSSIADLAFDERAPKLAALYLNEAFYGTGPAPRSEAYRVQATLRLPRSDTNLQLDTIEQWRIAAIIMHLCQPENPAELEQAVHRLEAVNRPEGLKAKTLIQGGYDKGMALLESEMPDEYLTAAIV